MGAKYDTGDADRENVGAKAALCEKCGHPLAEHDQYQGVRWCPDE